MKKKETAMASFFLANVDNLKHILLSKSLKFKE
jgi:hypothetical protein